MIRAVPPLSLAALMLLAGCGGGDDLTRRFGLTRDAPDEFAVTTRAPLSMPPDYTLRAPRPGAARPQELSSRAAGEAVLVPQSTLAGPVAGATPGQTALLNAAGPAAPADIRAQVEQESSLERPQRDVVDRLMFWRAPPAAGGIAVDPTRESQRLRESAALGQNPQDGDTPIIQPRKRGLLERLGF